MKIEKGVPIPAVGASRVRPPGQIAEKMEAGDSVLCDAESIAHRVRYSLINRGHKATMRKVEGGWRVWRIE